MKRRLFYLMCRNQHRESRKVDKRPCSKQKNKIKIQKLIFIKKEISDLSDKYFKIKVQRVLRPHGRQQARPPCPSPSPGSLLKLVSIESVMPSSHLILRCPLLLPPSIFPSIRVFCSESVRRIHQASSTGVGNSYSHFPDG